MNDGRFEPDMRQHGLLRPLKTVLLVAAGAAVVNKPETNLLARS